jgi:hypothetical protein
MMGIEHDDVPTAKTRVAWDTDGCARDATAHRCSVHYQEVADQKGFLHGAGDDHEGVEEEGADEEEENDCDEDGLGPLPKLIPSARRRFVFPLFLS